MNVRLIMVVVIKPALIQLVAIHVRVMWDTRLNMINMDVMVIIIMLLLIEHNHY